MANAVAHIVALDAKYDWRVETMRYVKRRSPSQNNLMWMWLNKVADITGQHTGYDSDDMHYFFKHKFLPGSGKTIIQIGGETVVRLTTTNLNTIEMHNYMEAIDRWAVEFLKLILPRPEDVQRR